MIRRGPMRAPIWMAFGVVVLVAARQGAAQEACCFADGTCQDLSVTACGTMGGENPGLPSCSTVPGVCIGCCQTSEPPACQENVTFVACNNNPNLVHYGSPAMCSSDGECVTANTPTVTPTGTPTATPTVTDTPTVTPTGTPGVAPAPSLGPNGLVLLVAVLVGVGFIGHRALRRRASF